MDHSIVAWTVLALIVTITPGPDTLLVAGLSMQRGRWFGLAAVAGISAGGLFYMAVAGFGLMNLLVAIPSVYFVVKICGAAYLAWIGANMLLQSAYPSSTPPEPTSSLPAMTTLGAPFRYGFLTNILNPKVALFYLAALPQFVPADANAPMAAAGLIGIHFILGLIWLTIIALSAARLGQSLRESRLTRVLNAVIGTFLVGIAARLVLEKR